MSEHQIRIARNPFNALTSTNPNRFIFHSKYNTFKIVLTGIVKFSVAAGVYTKTIAHGLNYIPVVDAFLMCDTNPEVIRSGYQQFYTAPYDDMLFWEVRADAGNIIFYGRSFVAGTHDLNFRYYAFESPL